MNFCFEIAAVFHSRLYGEGKRPAISKLTYIWSPSSRSYIVFALVVLWPFAYASRCCILLHRF